MERISFYDKLYHGIGRLKDHTLDFSNYDVINTGHNIFRDNVEECHYHFKCQKAQLDFVSEMVEVSTGHYAKTVAVRENGILLYQKGEILICGNPEVYTAGRFKNETLIKFYILKEYPGMKWQRVEKAHAITTQECTLYWDNPYYDISAVSL